MAKRHQPASPGDIKVLSHCRQTYFLKIPVNLFLDELGPAELSMAWDPPWLSVGGTPLWWPRSHFTNPLSKHTSYYLLKNFMLIFRALKSCNVCSVYFFLTNNYSGLLQVGFSFLAGELLWLLVTVQPVQSVAQLGSCSFPAQPARTEGKCHTRTRGQLFGLAAVFNIWIPSCGVINRSKREFRLQGEEIPLWQLIQSVVWECSRLRHSHWNTVLEELDEFLIVSPRADAEGDGSCQHGPSHPPCRHSQSSWDLDLSGWAHFCPESGRALPLALLYSPSTTECFWAPIPQGFPPKFLAFVWSWRHHSSGLGDFKGCSQYLGAICSLHRAGRMIHFFYCLCYCSPPAALWHGFTEQCFLQPSRAGICPHFHDCLLDFQHLPSLLLCVRVFSKSRKW